MFRNYLAAALRNLARSRLYAGISIAGLAVGICTALLSFLIVRNQFTFDHFIPHHERTYLAISVLAPAGRPPDYNIYTNRTLAERLRTQFKELEAVTRVANQDLLFRRGTTSAKESVYWADPNFFDAVSLPLVAGDPRTALRRADGIVIPRSIAHKYFGRESVIGATLEVGQPAHPMTVTAVIEDLPARSTQLETGILLSGLASWSQLTELDNEPPDASKFMVTVRTYLRVARGASLDRVRAALPAIANAMWSNRPHGLDATLELVKLDRVHVFPGFNRNVSTLLAITMSVGLVVLFAACVNFVNLATARASRRALEVAVRKASGASRATLIVQFLGEALLQVTLATGIAIALTEMVLPAVNVFMNSGAVFDYWRDPALLAWIAVGVVTLSVLAGIYPAFVLSSFRPAATLKGTLTHTARGNITRQVLVALQFAVLMSLLVAAAVGYQQHKFATTEALRVPTDQHLLLRSSCNHAFRTEVQRLPGVIGASCSGWSFLSNGSFSLTRAPSGGTMPIGITPVDAGLFELYDLKPLAGRFFSTERDSEVFIPDPASRAATRGVINETAVRALGFATPAAALGQTIPYVYGGVEIVGVVRDFSIASVEKALPPTVYVPAPAEAIYIDVKLRGDRIPETLPAIDALWARTGGGAEPLSRFFLDDWVQDLYLSVLRISQWFGLMAGVAVLLACLGLIGLSASTTERRTKEIGIRKAMGATRGEILRLMLWQFVKPLLWACVIAAPLSAYLMNLWLDGFAYHVELTPWPFLGAGALALVLAALTVSAHCRAVASAKPVIALRYE
jgi:putative ABC transport system permease protein